MPVLALSQTLTPRYISTGPNSNGYYEYLPAGYSTGMTSYPLIIFMQGEGTLGNGVSGLSLILKEGLPMVINEGHFPDSFNVKGKDYSFIVISTQFKSWPSDNDVNDVITYALAHYRVDTGRIYLTGLSMGGSAIWAYISNPQPANQLAATIPIAGGQMYAGMAGATVIANANLAVYATSNLNDPTVPSIYTVNDIKEIDSVVPAIQPKAIDTLYNAYGHDAWTETYNPSTLLYQGLNAYQWMLLNSRDSTDTPQPATYPAPAPDTIVWASFTATWPTGKSTVNLSWTPSAETNAPYFLVQRSANGIAFTTLDTVSASAYLGNEFTDSAIDSKPLADSDYYRIAAVFMDGKVSYSVISKVTSVQTPQDTVAWSSFTGIWPTGQSEVELSWATASESNDRYFLVQRSADGHTFNTFDTVAAAANAAKGHYYNALDPSPFPDSDYYRLVAVFLDGKDTSSAIIKVVSIPPVQVVDTVGWSDFTASWPAGQTEVTLSWTTTVEQNNQYFFVQRSADGRTFSTLDTVAASANSTGSHTYSAPDPKPLPDSDYYRIAAVFMDGKISYSGIGKVVSLPPIDTVPPVQTTPDTIAWSTFTGTWPSGQSEVVLSWATTRESNDRYFLVQRSINGQTFNTFDTVAAAANAANGDSYNTLDPIPFPDSDYYRLEVVFLDGTVSYSAILKVVSMPPVQVIADSIGWSDFTAFWTAGQTEVELNWTTTIEQNNHYFLIQRSADGRSFSTLDTVPAAANSIGSHAYSALDPRSLANSDFYRLAAVFQDGSISYSGIAQVVYVPPVDTLPPVQSTPDSVSLTSFTAQALDGPPAVGLNWATSFEMNDQYFFVQRSADGQTFDNIDTVTAAADSVIGYSYVAVDPNPLAGKDYYRLGMLYQDGSISYSATREVVFQQGRDSFFLSPNPAVGSLNLWLRNNVTGNLNVRVLDMQGRTLRTWAFVKQGELWTQSLDIGPLSSGSYILQVIGTTLWIARPFISK